jgi:phospholipid transport system substrate-binding protein
MLSLAGETMRRRTLLALTILAVAGAALPGRAAGAAEVTAPIRNLYDRLLQAMRAGKEASFQQRADIIAPGVDQALDLSGILQTSVGARWATLTPEQQVGLMTVFRRFTIASYAARFDSFDGQRLEVEPELRNIGSAEEIVHTTIVSSSGTLHVLDYLMRQSGDSWKAVDVLAEGAISQVAVQRSDFRRVLTDGGADALMARLSQKASDLANGAAK